MRTQYQTFVEAIDKAAESFGDHEVSHADSVSNYAELLPDTLTYNNAENRLISWLRTAHNITINTNIAERYLKHVLFMGSDHEIVNAMVGCGRGVFYTYMDEFSAVTNRFLLGSFEHGELQEHIPLRLLTDSNYAGIFAQKAVQDGACDIAMLGYSEGDDFLTAYINTDTAVAFITDFDNFTEWFSGQLEKGE